MRISAIKPRYDVSWDDVINDLGSDQGNGCQPLTIDQILELNDMIDALDCDIIQAQYRDHPAAQTNRR